MVRSGDAVAARVWRLRASPLAWLVVADDLAGMLVLAVYPLGWDADVTFYDFAYHHVEPGAHIWTRDGWGFPEYPFYRREPWHPEVPASRADIDRALDLGQPSYFVTPWPFETIDDKGAAAKATLVYSEFPGWMSPAVRDARWALALYGGPRARDRCRAERPGQEVADVLPAGDATHFSRASPGPARRCKSDGTTKKTLHQAGDLAAHRHPPERLERLHVREQ